MGLDIINNFGLPFAGKFLVSIILSSSKFGSVSLFPQDSVTFKGGQTIIKNMKITESLFSPIVQGSVILLDVGNFSDNANLEGFETISISFRRNNLEQPITFIGIVTQYSVINDDAEHSSDMNPNEKTRAIRLDFMNKDIFFANRNIAWEIPDNDDDRTDFLGWIADSGGRA